MVGRTDELVHQPVHALQRIDGSAELVGQLRHVIQPAFGDLQVLQLPGILHAEQKRYRRVFERSALRPSYALHPGNSFNSENPLGEFVQDEEVGRIAHIVIGLDHQNFRQHARLREVPLCGCHSDVAGHGLGYVVAVFVAHLVSGKCQQADEGNRARRDENRRGPAHDGSTHPSPSPHLERSLGIKETKIDCRPQEPREPGLARPRPRQSCPPRMGRPWFGKPAIGRN